MTQVAVFTHPTIPPTLPVPPPVENAEAPPSYRPRLLTRDAVQEMTGLKTTMLYDLMKRDLFPKQVKQGSRSYWWEHEVIAYMENLPRA